MDNNHLIVINVRGGCVSDVYSSSPQNQRIVLVDWDNINDGDSAQVFTQARIEVMPVDVSDQVRSIAAV